MKTRRQQPYRARIAPALITCLAGLTLTALAVWMVLAALVWVALQPILFVLFALAHAT